MDSQQHLKPTEPDIVGDTPIKEGEREKKYFKITISPELSVGA